ncbi:hypothetical protein HMPREF9080_01162, partial [Cardiobacterium valvarum F0432]
LHQAASLLASPDGVIAGVAKRRKHWGPPSDGNTGFARQRNIPSPVYGGRCPEAEGGNKATKRRNHAPQGG